MRSVYFVSDGTGITAETLGHTLLTQFDSMQFEMISLPYIDSVEKAQQVALKINAHVGAKPLVFSTLVDAEVNQVIRDTHSKHFDFLRTFLGPLEQELGLPSSPKVGKSHGMSDYDKYKIRMDAVNFALAYDDGAKTDNYAKADVILIGVSRCGKTPTCLYLALQYGILAANYPFTDEIHPDFNLPNCLKPYKNKCMGLTIDPQRLATIRAERRPNSQYAELEQCRREIADVLSLYQRLHIPHLNSTDYSIEEMATKIMALMGLKRQTS